MSESEWKPPSPGVFCWAEIPATDVARAKSFYTNAFGWAFRPHTPPANPTAKTKTYPEDKYAFYSLPDKTFPISGGIVHVSEGCHVKGEGAVKLYIYVADLEEAMTKIVGAGGKKCSEIEPESDFGEMMHFDDSEGNRFGIYTMVKKGEGEKKEE